MVINELLPLIVLLFAMAAAYKLSPIGLFLALLLITYKVMKNERV